MSSAVNICSNALLMLGAQPVASLSEANDRARLASNLWPDCRAALLRSHYWNCLVARVVLAADTVAPAFDYAFQYSLPGDWLRTISVGEEGAEPDYKHEGRKVLCDESPLRLRYVRDVTEGGWDSMLVWGATLAMKSAMAYAITQSASVRDSALQELASYLRQCRAIDGQDDPAQTFGDFRLLASRYTSGGW
ncbi:MAG: hypothetical protein IT518_20245 [Burkholderiales bacterium]|nr:hypothetical protein [Burkholderiales bacterium]